MSTRTDGLVRSVATVSISLAPAPAPTVPHDVVDRGTNHDEASRTVPASISDGKTVQKVGKQLERTDAVSKVPDEKEQNRRERTERDLSILMQKRINYLQNPPNCTSAKKLACSFHRNRCGFGCLMHQVAFCFILAYATERTLVIDSKGWRYSSEGWKVAFLPVSNCTIAEGSVRSEYPSRIPILALIKHCRH